MIELLHYQDSAGDVPLRTWLSHLRDKLAKAQILKRFDYLELGNFGDCASVGDDVIELRVHVGAGYRVYCARHGQAVVLLLCGGDKRSQSHDIKLAQQYWAQWKKGQAS
jgi:putative addiction module killer protein